MLAKPPSASVWLTKELVGDTATVLAKFHFTAVLIVKGAIAYNNELKIYEKYFWRCQRAGKNACYLSLCPCSLNILLCSFVLQTWNNTKLIKGHLPCSVTDCVSWSQLFAELQKLTAWNIIFWAKQSLLKATPFAHLFPCQSQLLNPPGIHGGCVTAGTGVVTTSSMGSLLGGLMVSTSSEGGRAVRVGDGDGDFFWKIFIELILRRRLN